MRFAAVGNMTIDQIVTDYGAEQIVPGGSAYYASVAASILGADACVVTSVGGDFPQEALEWLTKRHINVRPVQTDMASARFRLAYKKGKREAWLLNRGAKIPSDSTIGNHDVIHLGPVYGEIDPKVTAIARRKCRFLSLDIQGLIRRAGSSGFIQYANRNLDDYLCRCDAVKASWEEARVLTSSNNAFKIISRLIRKGPTFALVTLGSEGAVVGSKDGLFRIPAYPEKRQYDPTGAGDVMLAGWLVTFWRTRDPTWASAVGSALASMTVRHSGRAKFRISKTDLFRRSGWIYSRISPFPNNPG